MGSNKKDMNMDLINHLDKIHTTPMGMERIRKNLCLDIDDVVFWSVQVISDETSEISRKGKNWYIRKGTVLIEVGQMLERGGYDIKVLNTINFAKSMKYNPFQYIRSEKDKTKRESRRGQGRAARRRCRQKGKQHLSLIDPRIDPLFIEHIFQQRYSFTCFHDFGE